MTLQAEVVNQLLNHAGLKVGSLADGFLSTVLFEWKSRNYDRLDEDIFQSAILNVVRNLHQLNVLQFEERIAQAAADRSISENLVYAMSEIIRQLTSCLCDFRSAQYSTTYAAIVIEALDVITTAWSAFMAGDIKDIISEVQVHNQLGRRNWKCEGG